MKSPHHEITFGALALFGCLLIIVSTLHVRRMATEELGEVGGLDYAEIDEDDLAVVDDSEWTFFEPSLKREREIAEQSPALE